MELHKQCLNKLLVRGDFFLGMPPREEEGYVKLDTGGKFLLLLKLKNGKAITYTSM